jgi:hypothetical protein
MKSKKTLIILGIFLLILFLAGVFFLQSSKKEKKVTPSPTTGEKVFCPKSRPEVCTMECVATPPYICGSNGKFYCNTCQACADKEVEWYLIQETPCQEDLQK